MWPSIAIGLLYPALSRSARSDVQLLERRPRPAGGRASQIRQPYAWLLVGVVLLVAIVFSLLRFNVPNHIADVYTESLLFLVVALAIGVFSPSAGLLLVVLHAVFDLFVSSRELELKPFLPALAGRLVSFWLLFLLVVAIPVMSRAIVASTLGSTQPADRRLRVTLAFGSGALTAGALLFVWTQAVPYLIRPVFVWSVLYLPTDPAIMPVQRQGLTIVAAGIVLVLLVSWVHLARGVLDEEPSTLSEPDASAVEELDEGSRGRAVGSVLRLVAQALTVVLLGGLITGVVDVVIFVRDPAVASPGRAPPAPRPGDREPREDPVGGALRCGLRRDVCHRPPGHLAQERTTRGDVGVLPARGDCCARRHRVRSAAGRRSPRGPWSRRRGERRGAASSSAAV